MSQEALEGILDVNACLLRHRAHDRRSTTPSAEPDQVIDADEADNLIDRELKNPVSPSSAIRSCGSSSRIAMLNSRSYGFSQMCAMVRTKTSRASGGSPPIWRSASPSSQGR